MDGTEGCGNWRQKRMLIEQLNVSSRVGKVKINRQLVIIVFIGLLRGVIVIIREKVESVGV